eukprot:1149420-Rhodomonas_salina.2
MIEGGRWRSGWRKGEERELAGVCLLLVEEQQQLPLKQLHLLHRHHHHHHHSYMLSESVRLPPTVSPAPHLRPHAITVVYHRLQQLCCTGDDATS